MQSFDVEDSQCRPPDPQHTLGLGGSQGTVPGGARHAGHRGDVGLRQGIVSPESMEKMVCRRATHRTTRASAGKVQGVEELAGG